MPRWRRRGRLSTETPLWDIPAYKQFWPDGYGRIVLEETDTTMAEARRRAAELSGPTWIMAKRQSAATGRRGRSWTAPEGNFAATLFMPLRGVDPQQAALRTFVTSVALRDTLAKSVDPKRLALKWPNDVLLDGGKVAGILLESSGSAGGVDWLSIGIGVNLIVAPAADQMEEGAFRPVALHAQGAASVSQEDFLFWLASLYAEHERDFQKLGFDPIRTLWMQNAARIGEVITARTVRETHTGTFETVDEVGNLILRTAHGSVSIAAGDVFF